MPRGGQAPQRPQTLLPPRHLPPQIPDAVTMVVGMVEDRLSGE